MRNFRIAPAIVYVCLVTLTAVPLTAAGQGKKPPAPTLQPAPSPKLTPQQVITIVLKALQTNDKQDAGIATTFRFASPANKRFTGPLRRFVPMVKSPGYSAMLHFKSAARGPLQVRGDQAREQVTITAANGEKVSYFFTLSKQKAAPYLNCWMTDGVARMGGPMPRILRPRPPASDVL